MLSVLSSLAAAVPAFLRLGQLRLPVFGLVATAALIAALWLSQRTAALAGLDPERLWDAGVIAILTAFMASRLLLVAVNASTFASHPLLVMAQPSLTAGGLAVTALVVWLWLRRHGLQWRGVLDAWAAPAALLLAALHLGHFVEGTQGGMPTTLPWSFHPSGNAAAVRVHPVQLYFLAADATLGLWLLARMRKPHPGGEIAAFGLIVGGILSFLIGFLRQPYDAFGTGWLDPVQYGALFAALAGAVLWARPETAGSHMTTTSPLLLAEEPR